MMIQIQTDSLVLHHLGARFLSKSLALKIIKELNILAN